MFHPEDGRRTILQNIWHYAPNDSNITLHKKGSLKKHTTWPILMLHICMKQRKYLSVHTEDQETHIITMCLLLGRKLTFK